MLALYLTTILLLFAVHVHTSPALDPRIVSSLNEPAFEEAQQRDDTATRAFSAIEIKTSTGSCFTVNELSGDFRANLNPIQIAACNGTTGQLWDVITAGKHNDQNGTMLLVNTLTQACLNFDPRRAAGNQVIMFSCGGRADGGGAVTPSQLFKFGGGAGPLAFESVSASGTCMSVSSTEALLDQAACSAGNAGQEFTFGGAEEASSVSTTGAGLESSTAIATQSVGAGETSALSGSSVVCASTTLVTVIRSSSGAGATLSATATASTTAAAIPNTASTTTAIAVSGAGGTLNPSAAAEANSRDETATRALSSVQIKSSSGQCLFVDETAGDFRENLIPITAQECTGSEGEKWDFVVQGVHNNLPNSTLIVSSLTNGCVNFDPRRAAGNQVLLFSCGGRADGEGEVTESQLFPFAQGDTQVVMKPENAQETCLVVSGGKLDQAACSGDAEQVFTMG